MSARGGAEARRKRSLTHQPVRLNVAQLAPMLDEVMPCGGGAPPLHVLGHRDAEGHLRRITADYPNGWRLTLRLNRQFQVTSATSSLSLRVSAPPRESSDA